MNLFISYSLSSESSFLRPKTMKVPSFLSLVNQKLVSTFKKRPTSSTMPLCIVLWPPVLGQVLPTKISTGQCSDPCPLPISPVSPISSPDVDWHVGNMPDPEQLLKTKTQCVFLGILRPSGLNANVNLRGIKQKKKLSHFPLVRLEWIRAWSSVCGGGMNCEESFVF